VPEETCQVKGCEEPAARSISAKKVEMYLSHHGFKPHRGRIKLCKEHYKEYKKKSKADRTAERLGWERR